MNAHDHTRSGRNSPTDFPLPHPNDHPADDLSAAFSMLRVVAEVLSDNALVTGTLAGDCVVVLAAALDKIEPVVDLLEPMDSEPLVSEYREARRKWIVGKCRSATVPRAQP